MKYKYKIVCIPLGIHRNKKRNIIQELKIRMIGGVVSVIVIAREWLFFSTMLPSLPLTNLSWGQHLPFQIPSKTSKSLKNSHFHWLNPSLVPPSLLFSLLLSSLFILHWHSRFILPLHSIITKCLFIYSNFF